MRIRRGHMRSTAALAAAVLLSAVVTGASFGHESDPVLPSEAEILDALTRGDRPITDVISSLVAQLTNVTAATTHTTDTTGTETATVTATATITTVTVTSETNTSTQTTATQPTATETSATQTTATETSATQTTTVTETNTGTQTTATVTETNTGTQTTATETSATTTATATSQTTATVTTTATTATSPTTTTSTTTSATTTQPPPDGPFLDIRDIVCPILLSIRASLAETPAFAFVSPIIDELLVAFACVEPTASGSAGVQAGPTAADWELFRWISTWVSGATPSVLLDSR